MQSTPTTKILAIGTINPGVEPEKVFAMLPLEVRDTANLYLDGKIDQWYSQQNGRGVVFILNVTDPAAAHEMLEKLPLGHIGQPAPGPWRLWCESPISVRLPNTNRPLPARLRQADPAGGMSETGS